MKLASVAVLVVTLLSSLLLLSSYESKRAAGDIWKMLGITRQVGTDEIKNSFLYGYLSFYSVKNAKNIALNDRAAIAADLLTYTKQYVSGAEFKKQYDELRKSAMPEQPVPKPIRTKEQVQKEEIAKTEKSIKDAEKSMKELGPELGKGVQPVLDMLKQNLKDYKNIDNPYFAAIIDGDKYDNESNLRSYNERMEKWRKDFPETVNAFVAEKLKKMLEYTKDIDYSAELVEKYGKKRFVNPSYEGKRREWKQGYRAGKTVTEMARGFVEKWLVELK